MNKFNWHKEIFQKTLHSIGKYAGGHIKRGFTRGFDGFFEWFEENHPDEFNKYISIRIKIITLWGKNDGPSMEEFKKLLKSYEQAWLWAMRKYVEHVNKQQSKVPQEELYETL